MKRKLLLSALLMLSVGFMFVNAQNNITKEATLNQQQKIDANEVRNLKPLQVADIFDLNLSTKNAYTNGKTGLVYREEFKSENAGFIKLYIENFDLKPGDYMEVYNPNTGDVYVYAEKGKIVGTQDKPYMISEFWTGTIMGDHIILSVYSKHANKDNHYGFDITKVSYGYSAETIERLSQRAPDDDNQIFSVCGADDKEAIICYNGTEMYRKAEAVCRLLINGGSLCTGWLLGCEGNIMTNNHCIGDAAAANNTDFLFNYRYTTCGGSTDAASDLVATSSVFEFTDAGNDFTIVQLPVNPTATYGYLSLSSAVVTVGERIYIPQHPGGRRKEIAVVTDTDPGAGGFARISSSSTARVEYLCDTEGGSSGSPVLRFADNLVVSIHNTGGCPNGSSARSDEMISILNTQGLMPTCGVDDPNPASPTIGYSSTTQNNIEGTDCSFIDVNVTLNIAQAPSANADVDFTVAGGTATNGTDFAIQTPSITFPAGSTNPQTMTIRIFSDGLVEGDETVTIDFTVNANGGDASANTALDSMTFTITDDDSATSPVSTIDLINEDFSAVPAGWGGYDDDGDGNGWVVGDVPAAHLSTGQLYSRSWINTSGELTPDNYVYTQQLNIPANLTSLDLMFQVSPATLTQTWYEEYYTIYWTTDVSSVANILANATVVKPGSIIAQAVVNENIDMSAFIGQTGYLVFRHHNCTDEEYIAIDDMILRGEFQTPVQTAVNNGTTFDQIPLPGNGSIYTSDASTGDVMLDIVNNNTHDYGCIDISVARSGTGGSPYNGSVAPHLAVDKTFYINPTNVAGSGDVTITFYFTEAEIAGWEASTSGTYTRNDLYVQRDDAGPITFAPGNTINAVESVPVTVATFGTEVALTATFTGLTGGFVFAPNAVLSVDDVNLDNSNVSLFPNPTSGIITIGMPANVLPDNIAVYNMLGQEIITKNVTNENDLTIDATPLQAGMYFVKISNENSSTTLQFIRE